MNANEPDKILTKSVNFRKKLLMIHALIVLALSAIQIIITVFRLLPNWTFVVLPILTIAWGAFVTFLFEIHTRRSQKKVEKYFEMKNIFDQVWRWNLIGRGYYLLDVGIVDSKTLRQRMFEVKDKLSEFIPFGFKSMARFDQQETTRYHQDGGPDLNILMLGYEPSKVKSRLFIADHVCAANDIMDDHPMTPQRIIAEALFGRDELLDLYISELPQPKEGHSYILLINNSKELGVLHKAVVEKNPNEPRIINSIMLSPGEDEVGVEQQQDFLTTDKISEKSYQ